ncbi:MAG: Mth938-like domain-containing protein [Rickettsiales bacterium]|nr:Mth938-like domain-containing protein [Rickettsiales bacterium]
MDITPQLAEGAQRITAYGAGVIKVNQESFDTPLIIHPDRVVVWDNPAIDEAGIDALLGQQLGSLEILLIGAGEQSEFLPPALRMKIREATGAGVEVMDTGAACRTYNVLLAEGRLVAAAVMPV